MNISVGEVIDSYNRGVGRCSLLGGGGGGGGGCDTTATP